MANTVRIVVAPDKFKGSLSAATVAGRFAEGLRDRLPDAESRSTVTGSLSWTTRCPRH
ncbi:glycerate kinase [Arthrobacter sp. Ld5]|uniref:glycerate kinase n=1 Tax=Arthrobacter sp. Ld5 TaxID=649152 RepID=UPI003EBB4419